MNRVIKFRAWKDNRMISWSDLILTPMGAFIEYLLTNPPQQISVFMQFTGLLDVNGKEIYEGDIVELSINGESVSHVGVVTYLAPRFFVMDAEKSGLLLTDKYVVIGNIHEHPHLLTKSV